MYILVLFSILSILVLDVVSNLVKKGNSNISYRTFETKKGDLTLSITGTGTIEASESRKEISKVSSTVEDIYYVEGDNVKAGWPLVKLDSSDYEINVKSQRSAVRQAEISKASLDKQIKDLKIISNANGYIGNLNILEGTYVMPNTEICSITSNQKDEITLQFASSAIDNIQVGNTAKVLLTGSLNYVTGIVTFIGNKTTALASGATVVDVTIEVTNSQYALSGIMANAEITNGVVTYKSVNEALFSSKRAGSIKAETSGTVKKLYVKNGQYVNAGEVIAELENRDLKDNANAAAINLQNLYNQLSYAKEKLDEYTIYAPIDGTITMQSVKIGDVVSPGTIISTISNKNEMEFKIPVDELDIAKIDYDNKVKVTIDALKYTEDDPIIGKISKMPLEGVSNGGITDYYVTISIPGSNDVRISMNADAEIVIDERHDVLYVPVESVEKIDGKSYVVVVNEGATEKREVETGLKGVSYVEITSGLKEGEAVVVPEQSNGMGFMLNMY